MKTTCFKIIFPLLLLPFLSFAGNPIDGKYTKQKTIKKEFAVATDALLEVRNSYGNLDITTWNENRIVMEIHIKTSGNDEEKVQQRLDAIHVNFQNSHSKVRAETKVEQQSSWWKNIFGGSGSSVSMQIYYIIKMPLKNSVALNNDYGSINLDKLNGNANITCDYGQLLIGELRGKNNSLSFDYTRNSHISYIRNGKIRADYSEFTVENADNLEISADYTDSRIEKVKNIRFNCDYGSMNIGKLQKLEGKGDYLSTKIGALYNSASLEMDYGSVIISKLMNSMKNLKIESDYTTIKIGYESGNPFSFDVHTSYGNIKGLDGKDFQLQKRKQASNDNYYQGFFETENSGGKIQIEASYAGINFFKN